MALDLDIGDMVLNENHVKVHVVLQRSPTPKIKNYSGFALYSSEEIATGVLTYFRLGNYNSIEENLKRKTPDRPDIKGFGVLNGIGYDPATILKREDNFQFSNYMLREAQRSLRSRKRNISYSSWIEEVDPRSLCKEIDNLLKY